MKRWFQWPDRRTVVILVASLSVIPLAGIIFWGSGIIFTYTGSLPIGFYRIVANSGPVHRGNIVSFCLPGKVAEMGRQRGYLRRGFCANGSEALIKRVIAVPGDTVILADHFIVVNGVRINMAYPASTEVIDKAHLPVYRFIQKGTYQAKGYWVYGFGDPLYSWDSRYYGGVPTGNITHRLVPLWLF